MALKNMFGAIALDTTANTIANNIHTGTNNYLQDILVELKILNKYMEMVHEVKVTPDMVEE